MKKEWISSVVLRSLGVLLLAAASLKGHELLTTPVANVDIWSYRPFLVFQVEFELVLAIWLLSGLWKRIAWFVTIACFAVFCCVTLYRGLSGAASCGCFGNVHVNPWITLFVLDLPAALALVFFKPKGTTQALRLFVLRISEPIRTHARRKSVWEESAGRSWWIFTVRAIKRLVHPLQPVRCSVIGAVILVAVSSTTVVLALNEPPSVTASYEVLEPETWKGKELPILEHIDVVDELKTGTWLVLLYHYDCPDCARAIPEYERMARDLAGNEDFLRLALVAVPPYGHGPVAADSPCLLGRLAETKEWFVTTPAVALMTQGVVTLAWEEKAPDFDTVLECVAASIQ